MEKNPFLLPITYLIVMDLGAKPSVLLKKSESREEPRDSFMVMIMMTRA